MCGSLLWVVGEIASPGLRHPVREVSCPGPGVSVGWPEGVKGPGASGGAARAVALLIPCGGVSNLATPLHGYAAQAYAIVPYMQS